MHAVLVSRTSGDLSMSSDGELQCSILYFFFGSESAWGPKELTDHNFRSVRSTDSWIDAAIISPKFVTIGVFVVKSVDQSPIFPL